MERMRDPRREIYEALTRTARVSAPQKVELELCGVRIRISAESQAVLNRVETYFGEYLASGTDECHAHAVLLNGADALDWERDDPEFEILPDGAIQRDFVARWLEIESGRVAVAMLAPDNDDGLHNFLRWLMPPLLLRERALLLHGAAVIQGQVGHVFFGPSGAGKSTTVDLIARAGSGAVALGDDAVIVQLKSGRAWVHAAPLGSGYTREPPPRRSAPLSGLYRLRQDDQARVEDLPITIGAQELLASAMTSNFESEVGERLDLCLDFAQARPGIHELRFAKNTQFWNLIQGELK